MNEPLARLLARVANAENERRNREGMWTLLQQYVRPQAVRFNEGQDAADTRERVLLDSTAARALEMFSSFLMGSVLVSSMRSASSFRLVVGDRNGRPDRTVSDGAQAKEWAERAVGEVRRVLFSGQHSGLEALHNVCLDLGLYGTSCIAIWDVGDDARKRTSPVAFRHYSVWGVAGERDADGSLAAVYITTKMSGRQAAKQWPDHAALFQTKMDQEVEAVFIALHETDTDADAVPQNVRNTGMPWYGMWTLKDGGRTLLDARAYPEQPVLLPSWYRVDNSVWGRSPAMTAVGDVISANWMKETVQRGLEKLVDPPVLVRDGSLLSPLSVFPGGISYTDGGDGDVRPLVAPGASRIEIGQTYLRDAAAAIEKAFFVQLFADQGNPTGSKQPRTAYEVSMQEDERNRAVAPMVQRVQNSLIEPLVWRVLGILMRRGVVEMPGFLGNGRTLILEHVNPIVGSQLASDANGAMRFVQQAVMLAQADPSVMDYVNMGETVGVLHRASDAPIRTLATKSEVDAIRKARAEQAQQQAMGQMLAEGGNTVANLIKAQKA